MYALMVTGRRNRRGKELQSVVIVQFGCTEMGLLAEKG
jgi:hypothetical protein